MRLAGRVDTPYLESQLLQNNLPGDPTERMLPVYLPPGYDDKPDQRFPVIYVLAGHGGSGPLMLNVPAWGESFPERIDRLIRSGAMEPVIAVLPDCWTIFGGAQYLNSSALGPYEDYLTDELIPYVDAHYRTLPGRQHRGITGKSSGGYGAMVQAMRHPELFGALASHSGDIYFEFGLLPDLSRRRVGRQAPSSLGRTGSSEEPNGSLPSSRRPGPVCHWQECRPCRLGSQTSSARWNWSQPSPNVRTL
jgi:S-formylglutathione hydrolase FrmB